MTRHPSANGAARGRDLVPARAGAGLRCLMAVLVLAGFVAMHGASAHHHGHPLAGIGAGHHASPAPDGPGRVDAVASEAATGVTAVLPRWESPAEGSSAHPHDGCLLALAAGILALLLALLSSRRAPVTSAPLLSRVGSVLTARGPPPRGAPCLIALGVCRT